MDNNIKNFIRSIKDFPKPGIMFRDITTILQNPEAMKLTEVELFNSIKDLKVDKVVGIESRGFIFGSILARRLNVGFIPIRKPGKLPFEKICETYALEYGTDTIEIHQDAILPGEKVIIHDDLLATGGTAKAACNLIEKLGGEVVQLSFIVELSFLSGRNLLEKYLVNSVVQYHDEN
ncbi:MAG TPA: adenine phosphoribosyltransferase [Ignavibacteriaceae bacterium]|nr:adenine phosphoribosyltransferase [Ignavibacteriaceae bacterium]